jgi:hypothetical protein
METAVADFKDAKTKQTKNSLDGSRIVHAGPWRCKVHKPVLVYQGTQTDHVTRPNLCLLDGATGIIIQASDDLSANTHDKRHLCVSTNGGASWNVAGKNLEIGSYSLFSKPNGDVVVMPYDSFRYGPTKNSFAGRKTVLSWKNGELAIKAGTTIATMPKDLMPYLTTGWTGGSGVAPENKPITGFWGTIQELDDG